jgi:glycerophosphoryl diester phosphodiesterase
MCPDPPEQADSAKPASEGARGGVSRRAALGAVGVGVAGVAAGAGFFAAGATGSTDADQVTPQYTVAQWTRQRGSRFLIAHRGSGDVLPEHTMAAYEAAAQWGALCMEISVRATSDGVLICMHDATYDRTTNTTGAINLMPSTILRSVGVRMPQLGPAWTTDPLPSVPLFEDVLRRFGGRLILCIDAKDDAFNPAMIAMVERHGLQKCVIVKAYYQSASIKAVQDAGYPVFAYFGEPVGVGEIRALARRLDRSRDFLVISPSGDGPAGDGIDVAVVKAAVATGVPVLIAPVHRRWEVAQYFALGVVGAICSSFGYLDRDSAITTTDTWRYPTIASGEMTKHPEDPTLAPSWTGTDELTLERAGSQQFMTMGQLSPVAKAAGSYRVEFQARWTSLPGSPESSITLAFGHADDRYYENRLGLGAGYHALLRADGRLQLFAHQPGVPQGNQLGSTIRTPPPRAGAWLSLRLDVTPSTLTWSRTDAGVQAAGGAGAGGAADAVSVALGGNRGGYLHIGRSSNDGALAFRGLAIS